MDTINNLSPKHLSPFIEKLDSSQLKPKTEFKNNIQTQSYDCLNIWRRNLEVIIKGIESYIRNQRL